MDTRYAWEMYIRYAYRVSSIGASSHGHPQREPSTSYDPRMVSPHIDAGIARTPAHAWGAA